MDFACSATVMTTRELRRVFFFSSRRRHTRWPRDWSSDVCSSDLDAPSPAALHTLASLQAEQGRTEEARQTLLQAIDRTGLPEPQPHDWYVMGRIEIGRASCREREETSGGAGAVQ